MRNHFQLIRTEPGRAVCVTLLIGLCVFFVANIGMLYAKLDFGATGLGTSETSDFFVFYSSAKFLLDGGSLSSLYDPATLKAYQISLGAKAGPIQPFAYPPSYALLIVPLGALPYAWALICWHAGTLALFLGSLRLAGLRWYEILAAGVAPASAINIAAGQNGFLTSALLIAGMALMTRRPAASGVLFGILTVKPHLGLLIPFVALAKRQWTTIAVAATVTLGLIAVSTLAMGIEAWPAFIESLRWFSTETGNQTAGTVLNYSSTGFMAAKVALFPKPVAYLIQGAQSLFVACAVYWAYRQKTDKDLLLALMLVGTAIATPYAFLYDMPFVAVAVILMVRRGLRDKFLPFEALWTLWVFLAPFMGYLLNEHRIPFVPLAHLIFFVYILARLRPGLAALTPPIDTRQAVDAR